MTQTSFHGILKHRFSDFLVNEVAFETENDDDCKMVAIGEIVVGLCAILFL
jgi:hypothetical protein